MLERWLASAALIALLFTFAHWANEDDEPPIAPREATGLPPEMPEDDEDDDREPERREPDSKKRKGLVGGLVGGPG